MSKSQGGLSAVPCTSLPAPLQACVICWWLPNMA